MVYRISRLLISSSAAFVLVAAACAPATPAPPATQAAPAPASATVSPAASPTPEQARPTPLPGRAPVAPPVLAPGPTPTPASATQQIKRGGVLTGYHQTVIQNIDMHSGSSLQVLSIAGSSYNQMLQYDYQGTWQIVPDLAEKWEVTPDGKTFTFTFAKGVKWHDGVPFTSEDAKFSLDRIAHPPKGIASPRASSIEGIQKMETPDPNTLKITLGTVNAAFVPIIASGFFKIMPRHILEKDPGALKTKAVGTGPFKVIKYEPGVVTESVRNPDYFIKGLPYLDGTKFLTIRDSATQFAALRTKRVLITGQGSRGLSPAEEDVIKREKLPIKLMYYYSTRGQGVVINHTQPPFNDLRVRKALALAMDPQEVIDTALEAQGKVIGVMSVDEWGMPRAELMKLPGYRKPSPADLTEAKRLLAEAGYKDGIKTVMPLRSFEIEIKISQVLQQQLARIGVDAQLRPMDDAAFYDSMERRDWGLGFLSISEAVGDPNMLLLPYWKTGGSRNYGKFSDAEVDKLLDAQAAELNEKKRLELVQKAERILVDKVAGFEVSPGKYIVGLWQEVHGYFPHDVYNSHRLDWAWLDQ